MEAGLNNAQLHLVKLFSFIRTQSAFNELQSVLVQHYAKEIDRQMEDLWNSGKMNAAKMDELRNAHLRTPYNK